MNMNPIEEQPTGGAGAAVAKVRTAATAMYVQAGLAIAGVLVGVLAAAGRSEAEKEEARRTAERAGAGGRAVIGLVFFLLYVACVVALFVLPTQLKRLSAKARTWAIATEVTLVVLGVLTLLRSKNVVGAVLTLVIGVALPAFVLYLLNTAEAKAAFVGSGTGTGGFDAKDIPSLG